MAAKDSGAPAGAGRMRLAKYMAMAAVASRRKCEDLILEGRVSVNGRAVLTPAFDVDAGKDEVTLDGRRLGPREKVYLMLNKPAGYVCSEMDAHADRLVHELLPRRFGGIHSVGRLDRDSEGLLLFTNDGDFAQRISHPSRRIDKRYLVDCEGSLGSERRRRMLEGIEDEGEFLRPLEVKERRRLRGHTEIEVVLRDGRKREIRRICRAVGLEVNTLTRIRYGCLELGALPSGKWRMLTAAEVEAVQRTTAPAAPEQKKETEKEKEPRPRRDGRGRPSA